MMQYFHASTVVIVFIRFTDAYIHIKNINRTLITILLLISACTVKFCALVVHKVLSTSASANFASDTIFSLRITSLLALISSLRTNVLPLHESLCLETLGKAS